MALRTVRRETRQYMIGIGHFRVIAVVARVAVGGCAGIPGGMATIACHASVRPSKRELAQIVVE